MKVWMDLMEEFYGYKQDEEPLFGAHEIWPMPTFRLDINGISAPRAFSFAVQYTLGWDNNNDGIMRLSVLNLNTNDPHVKGLFRVGYYMDLDEVDNPRRETIRVGGELWNIKQMLWQDNIGSWH